MNNDDNNSNTNSNSNNSNSNVLDSVDSLPVPEFHNDLDGINVKLIKKVKILNKKESGELCGICQKHNYTHTAIPCRCFNVCKKCAMKMATGGKCCICHEYFTNFKLLINEYI